MTREEAINKLVNARYADEFQGDEELTTAHLMAIKALEQEPSNDMVSREVFEQVMWERNIAIEQLEELGYGFGEGIRTDGDTISRQKTIEAFEKWICSDYPEDYPIMSFIGIQTILEEQPSVKLKESCDDTINRQAVNILIDELARAISDERCGISRGRSTATIMRDILHLPPVAPQQKTGHWIYKQYGSYPEQGDYHCSECDGIDNRIPAYCPNCGAKMQEVEE